MELDVNKMIHSACRSKNAIYRKFVYWFCKHYFHCDIHPNENLSDEVEFAHSALGVVINEEAILDGKVIIQHHVTIGKNNSGVPKIFGGGVYIGAHAILIGDIVVGENAVIGAGCVVTKDVPPNSVVVGNPMRFLTEECRKT